MSVYRNGVSIPLTPKQREELAKFSALHRVWFTAKEMVDVKRAELAQAELVAEVKWRARCTAEEAFDTLIEAENEETE